MADVDIDPFGEHESRTDEPADEDIPPVGGVYGVTRAQVHVDSGERVGEGLSINQRLTKIFLTVCTKRYLSIIPEPLMKSIMIALCVTKIGFTLKARKMIMIHLPKKNGALTL